MANGNESVANALNNFFYHRERTSDLLATLSETDLAHVPTSDHGPLWKHFRHLGRVQENYIQAMKTGRVQFSPKAAHYNGGASSQSLLTYLKSLDEILKQAISEFNLEQKINWFGESVSLDQHIQRLIEHEVLHHGQFVVCLKLLKKDFPGSWAVWGLA
jgi:uncharacterized damage-inducible protein DinB